MLTTFLTLAGSIAGAMLFAAALLHLIPTLGSFGRRVAQRFTHAPGLDLLVVYFTVLPLIAGPIIDGWLGLAAAILAQVAALLIWQTLHELAHPEARRGPRIIKAINRIVGPWRNLSAVYVTGIVVPLFSLVRLAEVMIYPMLTRLVGLPKYRHGDWVSVSRHKFSGLIGHDLIWCLYCDWMTGVWSLGSEMLRNVESFWCPIRFSSEKKCANCVVDFPDIDNGWVPANGTMAQVAQKVTEMYPMRAVESAQPGIAMPPTERPWFGHPARLTIEGVLPSAGS